MDEKSLKTSVGQRIVIAVVALLLLGSTVLTYALIVLSRGSSSNSSNAAKIAEIEAKYDAKRQEVEDAAASISDKDKYFAELKKYADQQVKSYNSTAANNEKLKTTDLKEGTGRALVENDSDYLAYYVGWCPDGSIFDTSFTYAEDDTDKLTPTGLGAPIAAGSLIEGWVQGVTGMKINGIRQVNMAGELAYGETTEGNHICGMSNAPLRFLVLPIEDERLQTLTNELSELRMQLYLAYMGSSY